MKKGLNMDGKTLFWFGIITLTSFIIADYLITKEQNMTKINIVKDAKDAYMMIEVDGHHEAPDVCSYI